MDSYRRVFSLSALLFGFVGLAGCLAALVGVWSVQVRLGRAAEHVFTAIHDSVDVVRARVTYAQQQVDASKITTEEIGEGLNSWAAREVGERLELRLDVADRAQRMEESLQQVNHWLDVSESTVEMASQVLSVGNATGAPTETTSLDALKDEISSLRGQLAEATSVIAGIHERMTGAGEDKSLRERTKQAAQLAVRMAATLGQVDSRLRKLDDGLSVMQDNLHGMESRTLRWILVVAMGITFLVVWMAAGQGSLCLLAWKRLRRTPDTRT